MVDILPREYYFVTVSYNNSNYTIKYLDSIERLKKQDYVVKVIIVDNASKMEDFRKIENDVLNRVNTKLIRNKDNLGYFKALNVGISTIQNNKALYIIGNNDIEFDENFLLKLNNIEYDDDVLVLAPNVITRDGFHQNPHLVNRVSKFRKTGYYIYFSNYYFGQLIYWIAQRFKKPRSTQPDKAWNCKKVIHMGIGACYVLTENFFKYYNVLDDRVFLWGEEALLAGQVTNVNGKILYDPSIVVYHNENSSVLAIPTKQAYRIAKQSYRIYSRYL